MKQLKKIINNYYETAMAKLYGVGPKIWFIQDPKLGKKLENQIVKQTVDRLITKK